MARCEISQPERLRILENQEIIEDIRILVYLHDGSDTNAVERFYNIKGILGRIHTHE